VVEWAQGALAIAHNGNLVNAEELREKLETRGSIFQSNVDSEVIVHLIAASQQPTLVDRIIDALAQVRGAYSLVFLSEDRIIAARDPGGFRPLVLGRVDGAVVVASETCALDLVDAVYEREIEPGEIVSISEDGIESLRRSRPSRTTASSSTSTSRARQPRLRPQRLRGAEGPRTPARPGEPGAGRHRHRRARLGRAGRDRLRREAGCRTRWASSATTTSGAPSSSPSNSIRHFGVKVKLNALREVLDGKRVIVVDDSIVRGTTSRKLVHMIRRRGARRSTCGSARRRRRIPASTASTRRPRGADRLDALGRGDPRSTSGADSLAYLSVEGLYAFTGRDGNGFCDACFTGRYPVPVEGRAAAPAAPVRGARPLSHGAAPGGQFAAWS
jgi:amidophosphoribosyltransferase